MEFGNAFEQRFLKQDEHEDRSIEQTLDLGWDVLSILPRAELYRISEDLLDRHYGRAGEAEVVERVRAEPSEGDEGPEPEGHDYESEIERL